MSGWDAPQSIAAIGDTVVSLEGTLVEAKSLGAATTRTVNGVAFTGATTAGSFANGGGAFTDTTLYRGGGIGAALEGMLDCAIFSGTGNTTRNIPLAGLTVGLTYLVQIFVSDSRTVGIGNRRQTYSLLTHTLSAQRLGDELALTCRFMATATTENLGLNVDAPDSTVPRLINGYQLRLLAETGKKRPRINGSLINSGLCRSNAS